MLARLEPARQWYLKLVRAKHTTYISLINVYVDLVVFTRIAGTS